MLYILGCAFLFLMWYKEWRLLALRNLIDGLSSVLAGFIERKVPEHNSRIEESSHFCYSSIGRENGHQELSPVLPQVKFVPAISSNEQGAFGVAAHAFLS